MIDGYTTCKWRNLKQAITSQSHRICVGDSSFSRHLSQLGLLVNPILKRCPFRWQYAGNSPVTHRNWFRFSFNGSSFLPALGPCRNPFTRLSPVRDSQYFLWSLAAFLAYPTKILQASSGLMKEHSHHRANWSAVSLPLTPLWPRANVSWNLLCSTSFTREFRKYSWMIY
jgi:hypothetical protein